MHIARPAPWRGYRDELPGEYTEPGRGWHPARMQKTGTLVAFK